MRTNDGCKKKSSGRVTEKNITLKKNNKKKEETDQNI